MGLGPNKGLPERAELIARFDRAIDEARQRRPQLLDHGRDADARPAACVVAVDGFADLVALDPGGASSAMDELAVRLEHLVRSVDLLGSPAPGTLAVVTVSLAPAVAGSVVERITGAAAMPLEVGGQVLSLEVTVGLAFAGPGDDATSLVDRAEQDVARIRSRR